MGFKKTQIIACKPEPDYCVWLRFADGLEGIVDLRELLDNGVFAAWESVDFFNEVRVDSKAATLTWGEDIDFDPYVLREKLEKANLQK